MVPPPCGARHCPLILVLLAPAAALAGMPNHAAVEALVAARDFEAIQALGAGAIPVLVYLYRAGDSERRADVANVFCFLGWKSDAAAEAMLEDMHTDHRRPEPSRLQR